MKSTFSEYYRLSEDEIKALWDDCLFIVDANVLLNLYRYPEGPRGELVNTLTQVRDRIWMPFQAAFEYQKNRLVVVAEQKKAFDTIHSKLQSYINDIKNLFTARHPLIEPGSLVDDLEKLVAAYLEKLQPLSDKQPAIHEDDSIRDAIDELLKDKIGPEPSTDQLKSACEEGIIRYGKKIPPGFKDEKKGEQINFRGLEYEAKYGDLILWLQIIEKAKEDSVKSIVFITNDTKEDWWQILSGENVGPLPALKEELRRKSGVDAFHMFTTESFLRASKKFMKSQISADAIEQVAVIDEAVKKAQDWREGFIPNDFRPTGYLIRFDQNLPSADLRAAMMIFNRSIRAIMPAEAHSIFAHDASIELVDLDGSYASAIERAVIDALGIVGFDTLTEERTRRVIRRARLSPENEGLNGFTSYKFDIAVDGPDDVSRLRTKNWIKMVLPKIMQEEPFQGASFSVSVTSDGITFAPNTSLSPRVAQDLRKRLNEMDGVAAVRMRVF